MWSAKMKNQKMRSRTSGDSRAMGDSRTPCIGAVALRATFLAVGRVFRAPALSGGIVAYRLISVKYESECQRACCDHQSSCMHTWWEGVKYVEFVVESTLTLWRSWKETKC